MSRLWGPVTSRVRMIVPALKGLGVELRGIATATGLSANDVAQREGFAFAGASIAELLSDERTEAVVIATRHDTHAELVQEGPGRRATCPLREAAGNESR